MGGSQPSMFHSAVEDESVLAIRKQLVDHNIDVSLFGQEGITSIKRFSQEVRDGQALLMLDAADHKKLVRVVELVAIRIRAPGATDAPDNSARYLIEIGEKLHTGEYEAMCAESCG